MNFARALEPHIPLILLKKGKSTDLAGIRQRPRKPHLTWHQSCTVPRLHTATNYSLKRRMQVLHEVEQLISRLSAQSQ